MARQIYQIGQSTVVGLVTFDSIEMPDEEKVSGTD